jgi:hypothetical protein
MGLMALASFGVTKLSAASSATTYDGIAVAVNFYGSTLGNLVIADTGGLAPTGGQLEASYGPYASGTVSIGKASSFTVGGNNLTFSGAVVQDFSVNLVGTSGKAYTLTTSTIASCAWAAANGDNNGFAVILALDLNGEPIAVTGEPNQTITFDGWTLILNEHVDQSAGTTTSIQINAMHLTDYSDWDYVCASCATLVNPAAGSKPPASPGVPLSGCAWLLDNCAPLFLKCAGSL